jgi:hypothetical protein
LLGSSLLSRRLLGLSLLGLSLLGLGLLGLSLVLGATLHASRNGRRGPYDDGGACGGTDESRAT